MDIRTICIKIFDITKEATLAELSHTSRLAVLIATIFCDAIGKHAAGMQ